MNLFFLLTAGRTSLKFNATRVLIIFLHDEFEFFLLLFHEVLLVIVFVVGFKISVDPAPVILQDVGVVKIRDYLGLTQNFLEVIKYMSFEFARFDFHHF
jgi:hypothetical protein